MTDQWWAIVRTPDGVHCYELGDVDHDALAARLDNIRSELGVPSNVDPLDTSEWDVQIGVGEPHQKLLNSAAGVRRQPGRRPDGAKPPTASPGRRRLPHEEHLAARSATARTTGRPNR